MTDKEKVKAYDEALKKASAAYKDEDKHLKATLERIFPELNKNKDEMIKTAILNHLKKMWGNCQDDVCGVHVEDAIDWLEKQGEPKFKIGDWVVIGDTIAQILDIQEQYYVGLDINGKDFVSSRFLNDDKIHLWTIQNVKDGDVLVNGSNIFIFHFINNKRLMGYCHVNMDDGNFYNDIGRNECFCTIDALVTPATKEQRDALMKAMNDAGYEWDGEDKELKKLVPNRFDPNTLKPFDRVLVKDRYSQCWRCNLFSHIETEYPMFRVNTILVEHFYYCIPFNDDTKHLVGTTDEAPEYYRYWEE